MQETAFTLNAKLVDVRVDPSRNLLDVLRNELGLTGTKQGCDYEGECGACTVIMDGRSVASCLVLAIDAQGKEILTVEGMSEGEKLHPIQESFLKHGAIQCGFCTPGMVMSAKALLDENPNPTRDEVKAAISGNLCRCTGYVKIIDAVMAAAEEMQVKEGSL